jgi:hypothetical protein
MREMSIQEQLWGSVWLEMILYKQRLMFEDNFLTSVRE